MKTDLENAIIKLGKVLQEENESLDNIDTESLEMLALILNCEVTVRNTRVLHWNEYLENQDLRRPEYLKGMTVSGSMTFIKPFLKTGNIIMNLLSISLRRTMR